MEKKRRIWKSGAHLLLLSSLMICTSECKLGGPGKRVTTVTGRVIDEAQQPVDSVLIFMSSVGFVRPGVTVGETYTDKEGSYQLVVDVPKDFDAVSVGISFNLDLSRKYKDYSYSQDGPAQGVCCPAAIGSKKSYDFTLLFK